jgi:hypothetical protein
MYKDNKEVTYGGFLTVKPKSETIDAYRMKV